MSVKVNAASLAGGSINTTNTRALLRVVILLFIAAAGVASRLFSVIRVFKLAKVYFNGSIWLT